MRKVKLLVQISLVASITSFKYTKESNSIIVDDPNFGPTKRDFALVYPPNIDKKSSKNDKNGKLGLIFYFHGWTGNYLDLANQKYNQYAEDYNFIMVYPSGMSDIYQYPPVEEWYSWNLGDVSNTCAINGTDHCYDSCAQLNLCNNCSWTSCYDDYLFIQVLLDYLLERYSRTNDIDLDKFVLIGESNGGMFTYLLSEKLNPKPSHFIPIYGNLPINKIIKTDGQANLLSFYDRWDDTVPIDGGQAEDGYLYQSEDTMISSWRDQNNCQIFGKMETFVTPWGKDNLRLDCMTYKSCGTEIGRNYISSCHYDGWHGWKPDYYVEEQLWWVYNFTSAVEISGSQQLLFVQ